MAKEQPFRSVGQRGRQSFVRSDLQAADRSQQTKALAAYEDRQAKAFADALQRANQFEASNAARNSQIEINNIRFQQANQLTNQEIQNKNDQIVQQQALNSQNLANQFRNQIRDMENAQEIVRNQLSLQFMAQESNAIVGLGESFVKFSETLANKQVDRINKENEQARITAKMKKLLNPSGDSALENINQTQRFTAGADLDSAANELENVGQLRDATNIRSHNAHAIYGTFEGKTILSGLSLERRLSEAVDIALNDASLMYGSRNFERDLHVLINKTVRDVISDDDLLNVPAPILEKYFQPALLQAVKKVTDKHFNDNNALTKTKSVNMALSEFQVGSTSPSFADDISLLASGIVMKDPTRAAENLKTAATLIGETAQDLSALYVYRDFLLKSDLGKEFGPSALIEIEQQIDSFRDTTAKALKDELKSNAEMLVFKFQRRALTLGDPTELAALRDEALQELSTFPEEIQAPLFNKILETRVSDLVVIKQQNDESMLGVSPFEMSTHIRENLLTKVQPPEEQERLTSMANKFEKAFLERDDISRVQKQLFREIDNQVFLDQRVDQLQKVLTGSSAGSDKLRAADFRKEEITEFIKDYYATDPDPTPNGLRKAIKEIRPDLFEPIVSRENDTLSNEILNNDLKYGSIKRSRLAVQSGVTALTTIPGGSKSGVSYLNQETNSYAVRGLLGQLDADTGIFLTPEELQKFSAEWEIGVINEKLDRLSDLADVSPRQFLAAQKEFYPATGNLERREYPTPQGEKPTKVTYKYAFDFARDEFNLSRKGATVIANAMMEESSGITTQIHDQGTGYGLFGHRLTRRTALEQFAASMKRDKSDPIAQLTFALTELKDEYPGLFLILQSSNATDDQYFEVMKKWLRFHHSLYDKRKNSLLRDLKALN